MDPPTTLPTSLTPHQSVASSSVSSSHRHSDLSVTASSKPSRHVCPDCGRSYKAAETLNRHRKNHSDTTQYVCRVCSASFKRKDLLDRHSQIHIHGSSSASRNRSQRACTRCSRLKTRCDNLKPCTRCARGGHDCTYAENRSRARTDRSMTGSPTRRESSASSAVASDAPLPAHVSADIPISGSSIDSVESWDGDRSWAESLWTQSYPWFSDMNAQQSTSPDTMHHALPPTADEHDIAGWDQAFPQHAVGDLPIQVPMQNAFLDNSSVGGVPWPQWQRHNPVPTDASTSFDGQFNSRPIISSDLSTETGSNSVVVEPARQPAASHDDLVKAMRQQFASDMAQLAVNFTNPFPHPDDRVRMWQHISQTAESAFNLQGLAPPGAHLLQHYINLYCRHAHARWPVRYRPDANSTSLPPHLYLMMATVGAAYAGKPSEIFHVQMMDALRPQIILAAMDKQLPHEQILPLIESLFTIQACTLYFGDRRSFTFVPQISSMVMALGRRVGLFDEPNTPQDVQFSDLLMPYGAWERAETHRRLAIAFLRMEVFISLLLGTRPLVSYDVINVRSPVPDTIWLGECADGEDALRAAIGDGTSHIFSGLVRAMLDWNEAQPNLRFDELEPVLFGLQSYIWRFSLDPELARRLAAELDPDPVDHVLEGDDTSYSQEEMQTLRGDYARTTYALERWKSALSACTPSSPLPQERKSLLTCNLLYNISIMKLRANLPGLHRVALSCIRDEQPPYKVLLEAYRWATTRGASVAIESACSTWSLIVSELRRPESARAEFNILAHIGLLHAAVIVWVYAGVRLDPSSTTLHLDMCGGSGEGGSEQQSGSGGTSQRCREELRLCRSNNPWTMQSIAALLNDIQSLHGTGYASYYNTVEALAQRPLPTL